MKSMTRGVLAGAACFAVAVPAVALAANPVKGGSYSNQRVLSFANVSKSGTSATLELFPGKCNNGIAVQATKPAKIAGGTLSYDGTAKEMGTKNGIAHLVVSGKFVSSKSLTLTLHVTAGSCKSTQTQTLTLMKK